MPAKRWTIVVGLPLAACATAALSQHKPIIRTPQGQPVPTPEVRTEPIPHVALPPPLPQPGQMPVPQRIPPVWDSASPAKIIPPAQEQPPLVPIIGEAEYTQYCSGCHGSDGLLNKAKLPALGKALQPSDIVLMIENSVPMSQDVALRMTAEQKLAAATYVHDTLGKQKK